VFQAVFLVFARKARSIGRRDSVGGWLYQVANRAALRARGRSARRRAHQEPIGDVPGPDATDEVLWRDLRPVLDEEIHRLPAKYRVPFILCYLEGRTNEEAAEEIGCPKGTILSRLSRGREWLRSRLTRRGVALSAGWLATSLTQNASAAVPAELAASTVATGPAFAAGTAASGLIPAPVAVLTQGVLHAMFLTKLKLVAGLVALVLLGTGTVLFAQREGAPRPAQPERAGPAAPADQRGGEQPRREGAKPPDAFGKVIGISKDGKSITLEVAGSGRGEEPPKKAEFQLGEKTTIVYQSVGPNGAKPTEGYSAAVHIDDASKTLAASVTFSGPESLRRGPDVVGEVFAVAKDGKGITLGAAARGRGEEPAKTEVKFDDKTILLFSGVTKDGAKITEGYHAQVTLNDGPGSIAGVVHLVGQESHGRRGEKGPDVAGKIVSVDGATYTIELRPEARGEEAKTVTVKVGEKIPVIYQNVGLNGTKPVAGLQAQMWIEDGSKDVATRVVLTGVVPERWTTIQSKVVAVSKDGTTITLEQPAAARGEDPKRLEIRLTPKTKVAFSGVGPDEAKPVEGMFAMVRLVDGSKDTAAHAAFVKGRVERGR
jgi:RNA polymerase sigma factor (sigma-70 family)